MDTKKELKTTEAQRKASIKWQKANYKRIPLDVRPERHDELKKIAEAQGMTLGAWVKLAIEEKIKRDTEREPEKKPQAERSGR